MLAADRAAAGAATLILAAITALFDNLRAHTSEFFASVIRRRHGPRPPERVRRLHLEHALIMLAPPPG